MTYSRLNIGKVRARLQTAKTGIFQFNGKCWYFDYSESEQTISKFPTKQKFFKKQTKNAFKNVETHFV